MPETPSQIQPALLGGLVLGLGSTIPIISYGNLCCCGWGIVGGCLAAYLLIRRSPARPVTKGEGASTGAAAGVVGSAINLIIGLPLSLLQWNTLIAQLEQRADGMPDAASREMMTQIVATMQNHPVLIALAVWVVFAIVGISVAAVGGLLGVAIFEKRKGPGYPPPGTPSDTDLPPGYAPPGPPPGGPQRTDEAPYGASEPPTY
jgi:hypothetical protein